MYVISLFILINHNIRYVDVHIDAAYVHLKQPPEKFTQKYQKELCLSEVYSHRSIKRN